MSENASTPPRRALGPVTAVRLWAMFKAVLGRLWPWAASWTNLPLGPSSSVLEPRAEAVVGGGGLTAQATEPMADNVETAPRSLCYLSRRQGHGRCLLGSQPAPLSKAERTSPTRNLGPRRTETQQRKFRADKPVSKCSERPQCDAHQRGLPRPLDTLAPGWPVGLACTTWQPHGGGASPGPPWGGPCTPLDIRGIRVMIIMTPSNNSVGSRSMGSDVRPHPPPVPQQAALVLWLHL